MKELMLTDAEYALMRDLDTEEFSTDGYDQLQLAFPCAINLKRRGLIRAGITSIALTECGKVAIKNYLERMQL